MFVYIIFRFLIKFFSFSLLFVFVGAIIYFLFMSADLSLPLGELWYLSDPDSLQLAQTVIQRYIYAPLWFDFIVPYMLQNVAYIVLLVGVLVMGFLSYMLSHIL